MKLSSGKELTRLAELYGLKRRMFGLEPDFMLRRRLLKTLFGYVP